LAAINHGASNMTRMTELIPMAPLIASLTVICSIVVAAWKVRDLVATKSELIEVRQAVERCARKEDVESMRASLSMHISQSCQALKELQIEIARLDERSAARWKLLQDNVTSLKHHEV
jgi:cell division protein FtsL